MNSIELSIIDDDILISRLLKDYLNKLGLLNIQIYESGNKYLNSSINDNGIIILDLKMKDGDGLKVIDNLTRNYPKIKIIVLSSFYQDELLGALIKKGVHAFLPKSISEEHLFQVIQEVNTKGYYLQLSQIDILREQLSSKTEVNLSSQDKLSDREIEVLKLICHQYTSKEIGDKLYISFKTVETHKAKLLDKTGAKNSIGLIIYAIKSGIVDPNEIPILFN